MTKPTVRQCYQDASFSAIFAGFLAVLISYTGPLAIVFQAAQLAHLSEAMTASWIWAISIGSGVTGLLLSWHLRMPIVAAWSAPGAALLVTTLPSLGITQAVGAYLFSAALILIIGLSGLFDRWVGCVPKGIAAAMLAGILLRFGVEVFTSIEASPILVLCMLATFFLTKRIWPRYAIVFVMAAGLTLTSVLGIIEVVPLVLAPALPVLVIPEWSWHAILSLGLPLALVTLTGQYIPGMAVLHTCGYPIPAKGIIGVTAGAALPLALFGAHGVNLAAITAAICADKEAHEDPKKRYIAGMACGFFYILVGSFGATLVWLFRTLPTTMTATLAGLALLSAIGTGLVGMVQDAKHRDASLITFLVTISNMNFLGLGSAFWGLVLGGFAYCIWHRKRPV